MNMTVSLNNVVISQLNRQSLCTVPNLFTAFKWLGGIPTSMHES